MSITITDGLIHQVDNKSVQSHIRSVSRVYRFLLKEVGLEHQTNLQYITHNKTVESHEALSPLF